MWQPKAWYIPNILPMLCPWAKDATYGIASCKYVLVVIKERYKIKRFCIKCCGACEQFTRLIIANLPADHQCDQKKIAKCLLKLPKNEFTREIIDFDTFTKIV